MDERFSVVKTIVDVWDESYEVTVYRESKSVWIARGEYMGERIESKDATQGAALKRWIEAARYKGNDGPSTPA